MKIIMFISLIIMVITMLLITLVNLIAKKTFMDREKSSPFECGFDPKNSARLPFSLQFFLIAMIFLIFDVELTMLLPMILTMNISNMLNYTLMIMFFLIILLFGLYHEWKNGALEWAF